MATTRLRLALLTLAAFACARPLKPVTQVEPLPRAGSGSQQGWSVDSSGAATDSPFEPVLSEAPPAGGLESGLASPDLSTEDGSAPIAPGDGVASPPVPSWDIEVESYLSHDRVEYYIRRYTNEARQRVADWMQRGRRYEPMIRATFRDAGIPEDMYYLGFVESGYDVHAYSRAAAVGMWQFMTATGKGMGLRIDWWVDERRDPVRSTQAAAKFLGVLRDQFGSLYLAAAAYNGGPGRISRGLTQYASRMGDAEGDDLFFALAKTRAMRSETSNYVPQLIAAAAIGKAPQTYGITLGDVAPFAYDSARVPAGTPVPAVALAAGVELDAIRDLNPHLLRGVTPLEDSSWVRVPTGSAANFDAAFSALDDSLRAAWDTVKAKKGATVAGMAKAAGLTTTQLRWYNPKLKGTKIATGSAVLVPRRDVVRAAFDVPDPSVERYGAAVNGVHIVRKGETLSHIARRNSTTVARLMKLNGLKKSVIYPGQRIAVR